MQIQVQIKQISNRRGEMQFDYTSTKNGVYMQEVENVNENNK